MQRGLILLPGLLLTEAALFSSEVYLKVTKHATTTWQQPAHLDKEIVIVGEEIEKLGVRNIYEILKMHNVDVYRRSDMQQDFSLNGGSFEQVKILLDGIPLNDPQTGHHNCNIPITLKDIEYIQIVKSKNLSSYGNNAFSGVINIVPRSNAANLLSITYGSFDTYKVSSRTSFSLGYLSIDISGSSGYRENTDYNSYSIFSNFNYKGAKFYIGFLAKNFGAQDFYALNRKEYEETKTLFVALKKNFICKENISLNFDTFLRRGYDYYTTQRYRPEIYYNKHSSYLYGISSSCNWHVSKNILIQPSFEAIIKQLDSKGYSTILPSWQGMGNFYDKEYSASTTFILNIHKLLFDATLKWNYFSRYKLLPQYSTTLNINLTEKNKIFFSASKVIRTPSYTELFYWDPQHQTTTEDLKVEQTERYSAGVNNIVKNLNFSITGFYYKPTNVIDWIRTKSATESWKITNVAKTEIYGGELGIDWTFFSCFDAKLFYSVTAKKFNLPENKELKYIENYPTNSLSLILSFPEILGIKVNISNLYKTYTKTQPQRFFLTNISVSKNFKGAIFSLTIENLFDVKYQEVPGIYQPQRQMFLSINL